MADVVSQFGRVLQGSASQSSVFSSVFAAFGGTVDAQLGQIWVAFHGDAVGSLFTRVNCSRFRRPADYRLWVDTRQFGVQDLVSEDPALQHLRKVIKKTMESP